MAHGGRGSCRVSYIVCKYVFWLGGTYRASEAKRSEAYRTELAGTTDEQTPPREMAKGRPQRRRWLRQWSHRVALRHHHHQSSHRRSIGRIIAVIIPATVPTAVIQFLVHQSVHARPPRKHPTPLVPLSSTLIDFINGNLPTCRAGRRSSCYLASPRLAACSTS